MKKKLNLPKFYFSFIAFLFIAGCKKNGTNNTYITVNYTGVAYLFDARSNLTSASAGNKILFAGGTDSTGGFDSPSNNVDIYDVSHNIWTTAHLNEGRSSLAGASAGNKILFAGGYKGNASFSKTVDIYDLQPPRTLYNTASGNPTALISKVIQTFKPSWLLPLI